VKDVSRDRAGISQPSSELGEVVIHLPWSFRWSKFLVIDGSFRGSRIGKGPRIGSNEGRSTWCIYGVLVSVESLRVERSGKYLRIASDYDIERRRMNRLSAMRRVRHKVLGFSL